MRRLLGTVIPILAIFVSASVAQTEKIVFQANYDGSDDEIYMINADGTGFTQLTDNSTHDGMPSFSRDGSKIVFVSDRDGWRDIYVMDSTGASPQQVTASPEIEKFPEFHPDGTRIIFDYHDGSGNQIAVVDLAGGAPTNLTSGGDLNAEPSYSPDGGSIVFTSVRGGYRTRIFKMSAAGEDPTPLTDGSTHALGPSYRADGQRILFYDEFGTIMEIDPNGSPLSTSTFGGRWAAYSPDGTEIVYLVEEGDFNELFTFRLGSFESPVKLTDSIGKEFMPSWGTVPLQDVTGPVVEPVVNGLQGANGWYVGDIGLSWNVSDGESEVSESTGCGEQVVDSDTPGITFTCTATSAGGSTSLSVTIKRDTTAPTLEPALSSDPIVVGSYASAEPNALDLMSGVASASCEDVDSSTVGSRMVECTATDNAGNTSTAPVAYSVIFQFAGFFQPVENLPTLNSAKAGSSIPIKFSLSGYQGLSIFVAGSPSSGIISCDASTSTATIEETVNAGGSSLSYDAASDRYVYVWKTEKSWKGTCRQLRVRLTDGIIHIANFRFK